MICGPFDQITDFVMQCLDLMEEARALWGGDDPPPGPANAKLNEAVGTLQRAVSHLLILAGEANQLAVEKAVARGEHLCATCFQWIHESRMEQHEIEYGNSKKLKEGQRKSTWWTCKEPC